MKKIGITLVILSALVGGNFALTQQRTLAGFSDTFISIQLAPSPSNGNCLTTDGTDNVWGSCGSSGGSSFGQSWSLITNTFSQSALAPTTTQNIHVSGTGTSTFSGGLEAWRQISAPYFHATSSTASDFSAGGLIGALTGNADTATALASNGSNCSSGNAPLGVDASGAVESCFDVWTEAENTSAGYTTNTGTVTSVALSVPTGLSISGTPITTSGTLALTYDTGYAAVLTASTTNWNGFYDTPSTRITAGTGLSWSTNTLNAEVQTSDLHSAVTLAGALDYLTLSGQEITRGAIDLSTDITGILGIANGGTGTSTSALAGQVLAWNGSNWQGYATTTFSSGLTYSGGNVTADLGTSISSSELADADFGSFTCSSGTCTVDTGAISNTMLANSTISGIALGSNLANLTATNSTLTFSGTYTGATARTIGLNLGNANTWTALQTFGYASSTALSATTLIADTNIGLFGTVYSSLATLGTALVEAITSVSPTGVWNFGGATSVEMVNGASPTVDAIGEFALDTTANELLIATSTNASAPVVYKPFVTRSFAYTATSTPGTGTTTQSFGIAPGAGYFDEIECNSNSFLRVLIKDTAGNRLNDLIASSTIGTVKFTQNNSFTDGEGILIDVGTTTAPTAYSYLGCTAKFYYTRN